MDNIKTKEFGKAKNKIKLPFLLNLQKESWKRFWKKDLKELFEEISPIRDYTKKEFELWFLDYKLGEPKYKNDLEAKKDKASYDVPLTVKTRLINLKTKEAKEQEIYLCDFPLQTERGTFVVKIFQYGN